MSTAGKTTAVIALFVMMLCVQAQAWQNLFPSFSGLTFGADKFVAVSSDGVVMVLDKNGDEQQMHFNPNTLYSIAFGNGIFLLTHSVTNVGTARSSSLISSPTNMNWVPVRSSSFNACKKVTFGNGIFVGVGEGNKIFVYDEEEWEELDNESSLANITHSTTSPNRFVAVGSTIISSTNTTARNWNSPQVSNQNFSVAAFGTIDGSPRFVAYGYTGSTVSLFTSDNSNGTNWTQQSSTNIPAGMADMTWGNGTFAAVGANGTIAVSSDGISWNTTLSGAGDDFKAVRYGDGVFIALGTGGSVYTSDDKGNSWNPKVIGHSISYRHITFGGGLYMAVGDNGALVSSDGKNWTKKYADGLKGLIGVTYGDNMFVAVSSTGGIFATKNNGDEWEMVDPPVGGDTLVGVAYNDVIKCFVAMGKTGAPYPAIYTSDDGLKWTRHSGQTVTWNNMNVQPTSIVFAGGKFWAGSTESGQIYTSDNIGTQWTIVEPPAFSGMIVTSITYANGKFTGVLEASSVGAGNMLFSSNDAAGTQWQTFPLPPSPIKSVTYAGGHYIAVGDSGKIFTSTTGQSWSMRTRMTNRNLTTVYGDENNVLLAAGANGAMLYSTIPQLSVRHKSLVNRTAHSAKMSIDTHRSTPKLTLSFPAQKDAKLTFYSLNGKTLYTHRLKAGEISAELPKRLIRNGVVIAQYTSGDQKFSQRFQFTK